MTVSPLEALWLLVTLFGLIVTLDNVRDSWLDRSAVRGTGRERELVAWSNVRREAIRVVITGSLLLIVIPALLRPGDVPLSLGLVIVMLIPIGMALNSFLDRRTRRRLLRLLEVAR